ncbi:MAG: PAS domain-containing protein, partial [Myxococcota bacterium]
MSSASLLSFLDAPVVVGDPDGCAAYVNPAFETCFAVSAETVTGQPLASLFEGGVREAVLQAVAEVCAEGRSTRFRVRHGGLGYGGLASPIVAEDARVGFVILLFESAPEDERALALQRQLREPLSEISRVLDELGDADVERRRLLLDDAQRAAGLVRKTSDELGGLLGGARGASGAARTRIDGFDPGAAIGTSAAKI